MNNNVRFLSNEQLLEVLSYSGDATAIHISEAAVIQYANQSMLSIWGKDKNVIGKPLEEALPELKGQPFIEMFKRVWREGITVAGTNTPANLEVNGQMQTFYFDYEYRAIKNEQGETCCILHMAKDVTDRVLGKEREQNLKEREQNLIEELRSANEELLSANEETNAINEELSESQRKLFELYEELKDSDQRFRNMVKHAPVGICIIRTNDLFIQDVNNAYLKLVGRERCEFEGQTIWEAIPEAAETYAPLLNEVIQTGIPFIAKEHELTLVRNGIPETVFIDFVYEPMSNDGIITAIMVLGFEVTDKVVARRKIEEVEERVRLAVDAAEIGTFDLDLVNNVMLTSEKFNAIFGFDHHVSWEKLVDTFHPDDRNNRIQAHKEALLTGKLFYEARIIHADSSIHWIRVQGNVYYDQNNKPQRILGTLLDITLFMRLVQQKDDFISIASHELKTPITSLSATLQLLDKMKNNPSSDMLPKMISQSRKSMQKIRTLIDDLLNIGRIQQGDLPLNKTTFIISELLNACCNPISVAGKHRFHIIGDKELQVHADEHRIDQVIVNFINNAVKYAPNSIDIALIIHKQNNMVRVSVKDSGPGIPKDKLPHLFDRYYRIDSNGYHASGLGLGLYISSEIIKRHGGDIGAESELGKGSTFWFTLPLTE